MFRRSFAVLALSLVAVVTAGCLAPPVGPAPLRYRDEMFATVTKTAGITYGTAVNGGATVILQLDLYQPTGDTVTGRPAVIFIHGGGFSGGNRNSAEIVDQANTFARKGFVTASISYRLTPGGCSAANPAPSCGTAIGKAFEDAQAAVQFLRTNAMVYGIDETRIAVGGSSAGAITAMNVAYATSSSPLAEVRAAMSISGAAIPTHPIGPGDPPTLLFHGTADFVVPYAWAQSTYDSARADGLPSYLISWPGGGHVPYVEHRTQIIDTTTNFLYLWMDLTDAPQ